MKRHYSIVMLALTLLLGACGKLSSVGDEKEPEPHATASTLGWPYTVDSPDLVTATVRSGGTVLLSGKNSQKGANDTGVPLIRFEWEQVAGPKVDFVYRTANTIFFSAPQDQPDNTELRFKLTVYDAKGNHDSTEARVLVRYVPDSDHYLHYLGVPTTVTVGLVTTGVNPPMANAASDTAVKVTMTKLVSFVDRNGIQHTDVRVALDPVASNPAPRALEKSTAWTAQYGGSTTCGDPINPSVELPLPRLNLDDVLIDPVDGFPNAVVLGDVIEPSDVDQAVPRFRLDAAAAGGVAAALCVGGVQKPSGSTWNANDLVPVNVPWDSADDASAYYKTIDPDDKKVYFDDWLSQNGMDTTLPKWGADAHAVYTNDFDLGFGRNMYLKTGLCDSGYTRTMPVQQRLGKCDVAAVVVNYGDLEAAAKRTAPIIAVAMEYSRVSAGGVRFTKFYIYAPNTGSGKWTRVTSVNLDGRGEQYVPGTCTVCHGGLPASQAVQLNGPYPGFAGGGDGNVNASFLPWDLDALLFSDTDPGFSQHERDATLKEQYTADAQLTDLKALNLGAYSTWSDPASQTGRFALARELLETWYGSDLSSSSFNGVKGSCADNSCVPNSWKEDKDGGSHLNPAGSATIYRQVFASNCRACHINQIPQTAADSAGVGDPRTWASCNSAQIHTNIGHQLPMACYWQFADAPSLAQRLSNNDMPFARRTSDQFWRADGGGAALLDHLRLVKPNPITVVPGVPVAQIGTAARDPNYSRYPDLGQYVELDGGSSTSARNYSWSVYACTGTEASPGNCARRLTVIDAAGSKSRFMIDDVSTYRVQLALNSGAATAASYVTAPNLVPAINTQYLPATLTFAIGATLTLNQPGTRIFTTGNGPESGHQILVQSNSNALQVSPASCLTSSGCAATTSISITTVPGVVTTATSIPNALRFTVRDADPGATPSTVTALVNVNLTSTFTAPPVTLATSTDNRTVQARDTTLTPVVPYDLALLAAAKAQLPSGIQNDVTLDFVSTASYGTLTRNGSNVSYTPPEAFSTHLMDGSLRAGGPTETFTYRLKRTSNGETSAATATIPVRATGTFTQAVATWRTSSCGTGGCHNTGSGTPITLTAEGNLGTYAYNTLRNGSLSRISTNAYVVSGSVATSGLYCWPTVSCSVTANGSHTGATRTATEVAAIRKWLESGANNDP